MSSSTYKLTYFPIRARGECARLLFAQANVPYEDDRVPFEKWAELKPHTPFGTIPILEVDGVVIAQSFAINRFLARKFGLAGKTPIEEAKVDMIADLAKDFNTDIGNYLPVAGGLRPGDKEELYTTKVVPAIEKYGPFLVKALKESGSGFFVGKSVTWADLMIADFFRSFVTFQPTALDKFADIKAHMERIEQLPNIKKWIESRPPSTF